MKKISILLLFVLVMVFSAGCGGRVTSPQESEELDYDIIIELDTLPHDIKTVVSNLKGARGYFVFDQKEYNTGDILYLLISSGEKATGGYTLEVNSVSAEKGTLSIIVEEEEPAADASVIQALTYPFVVIKIGGSFQNYNIINTDNDKFDEIQDKTVPVLIEKTGIYTGQIDNNFIEIKVDNMERAYMLPEELSWMLSELLNSGDAVVVSYYENSNGQLVIRKLDTEARDRMVMEVHGVLVGQIDSNSVEINVDGEPKAFRLAEQILIEEFNDGDNIIIDYYTDEHGRFILNKIQKAN
ncbi:MAG: protease complex subunit PrcB family protein [Bacillota bacterium]|nr:protease complex subunit PrcB family protein [Bacillota bacterium]